MNPLLILSIASPAEVSFCSKSLKLVEPDKFDDLVLLPLDVAPTVKAAAVPIIAPFKYGSGSMAF